MGVQVLLVEILCFREIISIGHVVSKEKQLPWFRTLNWCAVVGVHASLHIPDAGLVARYFLLVSNYYFYGDTLFNLFMPDSVDQETYTSFIRHHKFHSFCLYTAGM
jgi:phosphatidate cytidylyltransferase